jgi:hypothetical protein
MAEMAILEERGAFTLPLPDGDSASYSIETKE